MGGKGYCCCLAVEEDSNPWRTQPETSALSYLFYVDFLRLLFISLSSRTIRVEHEHHLQ